MNGSQVFKIAVNTLDQIVDEALIANNLRKEDIDWLVPHQANIRILEATAKKLEMSMELLTYKWNQTFEQSNHQFVSFNRSSNLQNLH